MFVCAVANNGWISIVKVSIGAYGYSASRKAPKDPKNPLRFFLSHFVWLPKGPIGKWERGWRPPPLGPYESGGPKGPPALRRSEKEGGWRSPKPSRILKKLYWKLYPNWLRSQKFWAKTRMHTQELHHKLCKSTSEWQIAYYSNCCDILISSSINSALLNSHTQIVLTMQNVEWVPVSVSLIHIICSILLMTQIHCLSILFVHIYIERTQRPLAGPEWAPSPS